MIFQQIRNATVIVALAGKKFLIDPWLADKGSYPPVPSPFNNDRNPLVELPLSVSEIIDVDAVIVTHMHHFDHFDEAARKAIPKEMPMFTQNEKEAQDMRGLGFKNVGSLHHDGVPFKGVMLYRTDGEHGRGEASKRNYQALNLPDEVCGVVLTAPGEKTVYIAGDTVWSDKIKEAIDRHQPGIIILNAAQASFADGTPILMGADGVYEAARAAPKSIIIASHMDAVNHARLGREDLKKFIQKKGITDRVLIPEDGEAYTF